MRGYNPDNFHGDGFIISAGNLIDGTGAPARKNAVIEIKNEDIISIRAAGSVDPRRYHVIDYSDCTLLPWFIDCHVHLALSGEAGPCKKPSGQSNGYFDDIKDVIEDNLGRYIPCGVMAVRDGGDRNGYVIRYRKDYLDKDFPLTVKIPGPAWHASGRYGNLIGRPVNAGINLSQSVISDHHSIDHVKIINSGLNSLAVFGKETEPQFTSHELREAVCAADSLGLKVMVHANGKIPVRAAVESGCHSVEHGYFMGDENLKRMAEGRVTWVPTLFPMKAYSKIFPKGSLEADIARRTLEDQLAQVSFSEKYGVKIATGTDSGSPGTGHGTSLKEEMRLLFTAGLSIESVIKCATNNGAELLGMGNHIGKLMPGMKASFLVLKGTPEIFFDSIDNPVSFWINGKIHGSCHPVSRPLSSKDT